MNDPIMDTYEIYQLSDPRDGSIHYIGMSKDAHNRFKQRLTDKSSFVYPWVKDLALTGKKPMLTIISYAPTATDARMIEKSYIQQKGKEFPLLNRIHNYDALEKRAENETYNQWLQRRFANLSEKDMQEGIRMVKLAHSCIGRDRWEDTYETVTITIQECGAKVSIIDQIKIAFKVYGVSHINGCEVEA